MTTVTISGAAEAVLENQGVVFSDPYSVVDVITNLRPMPIPLTDGVSSLTGVYVLSGYGFQARTLPGVNSSAFPNSFWSLVRAGALSVVRLRSQPVRDVFGKLDVSFANLDTAPSLTVAIDSGSVIVARSCDDVVAQNIVAENFTPGVISIGASQVADVTDVATFAFTVLASGRAKVLFRAERNTHRATVAEFDVTVA
jgi:hypothetical protein